MVAAILSQDILAICLFIADGNMDLSLEEVIQRIEDYQEKQDRHFGISRSDFRNLFYMLLVWELGVKNFGDKINDIKLSGVVADILDYRDAYFNDEGESWDKSTSTEFECWYGYDEGQYNERMKIMKQMKNFFHHKEICAFNRKVVKKFMKEIDITENILYICSRPGESS